MKRELTRWAVSGLMVLVVGWAEAAEKAPAMDGTSAEMWGGAGGAKTNLVRGAWLKDSRFAMFIHWGDRKSVV